MIIAIWFVTLLLLGLWTLAAWGLASLMTSDGAWIAQIEPWLGRMPFGGWLESWFPDWLQVAHALLAALQGLLAWLGGAAPMLVWGVWLLVTIGMLLLAGGLSLLVALIRKSAAPPNPPQPPQAPQPPQPPQPPVVLT